MSPSQALARLTTKRWQGSKPSVGKANNQALAILQDKRWQGSQPSVGKAPSKRSRQSGLAWFTAKRLQGSKPNDQGNRGWQGSQQSVYKAPSQTIKAIGVVKAPSHTETDCHVGVV
jgi:hypothetical protein